MSAKWAAALLVIVVLGLLMVSGSALSRSEMTPRDAGTGPGWVTQDGDGGPDDFDPGDGAVGDDDNWDKPTVPEDGPMDAEGRGVNVWTDESPDLKSEDARLVTVAVWMRLLFVSVRVTMCVR